MEIDLDNTYNLIETIIIMLIITVTQSIFKLGPPDFA